MMMTTKARHAVELGAVLVFVICRRVIVLLTILSFERVTTERRVEQMHVLRHAGFLGEQLAAMRALKHSTARVHDKMSL